MTYYDLLGSAGRIGGATVLGLGAYVLYDLNYGSAYGYTLRGTLFTIYGKRYNQSTEAGQAVLRIHEAAHQEGYGEVPAYRAMLNEINILLSRGTYGGGIFGGEARELTECETQQLIELRGAAQEGIEYYSKSYRERKAQDFSRFIYTYMY